MAGKVKGSLAGLGISNFPAPDEKSSVNTSGKTNSGFGDGGSLRKSGSAFGIGKDVMPEPGDDVSGSVPSIVRPKG